MIESRAELIFLLNEAAELEHSLCCQYLYAAFSLKQRIDDRLNWEQLGHIQDWCQTIFMIARQEMEHLSLVSNLLTAIGGAPAFVRPNFPQPAKFYPFPLNLEPFSEAALRRFVYYEEPADLPPERSFFPREAMPEMAELAVPGMISATTVPFRTVAQLYEIIRWGFVHLPLSDSELFIGPAGSQISGEVLNLNFPRVGSLGGIYDTTLFSINNRATALKAIDLIVEQGEGPSSGSPFSHYQRFLQMYTDLVELQSADPDFQPAQPLVSNPYLRAHPSDTSGAYQVTNPHAVRVLDLFNSAYETLLLLLARFYGHSDETQAELEGLMYTLFPMMTMVLRPLAEVLTTLPAGPNAADGLAGPSFETSGHIPFLPHKRAAWLYLCERLTALAADCSQLKDMPGMPPRLAYIAESIDLLANKFQRLIDAGSVSGT